MVNEVIETFQDCSSSFFELRWNGDSGFILIKAASRCKEANSETSSCLYRSKYFMKFFGVVKCLGGRVDDLLKILMVRTWTQVQIQP